MKKVKETRNGIDLPMNMMTLFPLEIKSPSVGHSSNPSWLEGVNVYESRPTALNASANLLMSIASSLVMSKVTTSFGCPSTHDFTVPR